jgi:3-oxoacyl-[acyl-carrier protein] reductase
MPLACLALGSNLGDRHAMLAAAIRLIRAETGTRLVAQSRWYETDPVDCPLGSSPFLNGAVIVETDRQPDDVVTWCQRIEEALGRQRSVPNSPRTIDLDLLLYDDRIVDHPPDVIVPHPRMHERAFVLVPLAEIAPHAVHPILNSSIAELAARVSRDGLRPAPSPPSPPQTLAGLRALVTGSTSGIGAAIAAAYRERGADVITCGRRSLTGPHVIADFRNPADVDRLAGETWGRGLDLLVNVAGADILTGASVEKSFDEKLAELWAVDVVAMMRLSRAIGAKMKRRGCGTILTIGWDQAETGMGGDSGQLFGTIKGAVHAFTKSLAATLASEVRVNGIAPGWIRTEWGETASSDWQQRVRRDTLLERWGLTDDIAAAAVWLADPAAAYVTGQIVRVNGGAVR